MKTISLNTFNDAYFSSDFHLFHDKDFVWGARGFSNVAEHTSFIKGGLEALPPNSAVVHAGDMFCGCSYEDAENFLLGLQMSQGSRIFHVWGNHESQLKKIYQDHVREFTFGTDILDWFEFYPVEFGPLTFVGPDRDFKIGKRIVNVHHFPKVCWDKSHCGRYGLSGHNHGGVPEHSPQGSSRCLDVGVDNAIKYNGTPFFSKEDVIEIMKGKKVVSVGHHQAF